MPCQAAQSALLSFEDRAIAHERSFLFPQFLIGSLIHPRSATLFRLADTCHMACELR